MGVSVAEVVKVVESLYPPGLAQEWDSVGLICGDLKEDVNKILVALDPVQEIADEAVSWGADFLLTHHPLFLRGTNSVATTGAKGRVVHTLIRNHCALMNAHTNADSASQGVAEALAELAEITDIEPLQPSADNPALGIGRVGNLEREISLSEFCQRLANNLPASPGGLLCGGDLAAPVRRIAVSGGAGDSLLGAAREAEVDVFVTADLRHHPASEHLEEGPPYLVCGTHWATEWPWVPWAAKALRERLGERVEVQISDTVTEPWTAYFETGGRGYESSL